MSSSLHHLKVFTTYPHACSYLSDQEATTLFVDPKHTIDQRLYTSLSRMGFRRSGAHVYKPHCHGCMSCIPVRIPVDEFAFSANQRRVLKNNKDLRVSSHPDLDLPAAYALYDRYIRKRHPDGDMFPPSRDQFDSFLGHAWDCTNYYFFWHEEDLKAVAVVDHLSDGFSAIYTYFDPDESKRSLGKFVILWQIRLAQQLRLPYVYLGYWVQSCRKMDYKIQYKPIEVLRDGEWQPHLEVSP